MRCGAEELCRKLLGFAILLSRDDVWAMFAAVARECSVRAGNAELQLGSGIRFVRRPELELGVPTPSLNGYCNMPVTFIIGRAGSGKTTRCLDR